MLRRLVKFIAGALGVIIVALVAYLLIAPPAILRVATNYSAKMVCSNVFIANRDAQEVMAVDVQAPGHPLLRLVTVEVDASAGRVDARMLRFFAPATSQHRTGLGCTNIHDTPLNPVALAAHTAPSDALWPVGNTVAASQDPRIAAILSDQALLGEGYRAVVVVQNGRIIGETYADGFDASTPLLGWSMTKTVTAALLGTLIQSGNIVLTDDLTATYPNWAGDARADITVADMLAMASGLEWNEGYGNVSDVTRMLYLSDDMAGFAGNLPSEAEVGTVFNYSSGTTTALSRVWQDIVGDAALTYPQTALFELLGMTSAVMETDATDTFVGSSYMYATGHDWARFGQFLLQQGAWDGQQIMPRDYARWMAESVAVSNDAYTRGHMWREASGDQPAFEDVVWLRGHDGQSIAVFPSQDMVVVRLGLTPSQLEYSSLPLTKALAAALQE